MRAGARAPDLARVRKLTLYLDPSALLLGEVQIGRVLLEGADILIERNEVADTNLDMLPPPDGSGPHPGENRSLGLKHVARSPWISMIEVRDSVLTVAEGSGRPPVVLESRRRRSSRRRRTSPCRSRAFGAQAARRTHRDRRVVRRLDARRLPGNIDLQGGFGGGRRDQGQRRHQGHQLAITADGPDISAFGPSYACRCRPPALCAKRQGRHLRSTFKVELTSQGRLERAGWRGSVPHRPQRHAAVAVIANMSRLDLGGPKAHTSSTPAW